MTLYYLIVERRWWLVDISIDIELLHLFLHIVSDWLKNT